MKQYEPRTMIADASDTYYYYSQNSKIFNIQEKKYF